MNKTEVVIRIAKLRDKAKLLEVIADDITLSGNEREQADEAMNMALAMAYKLTEMLA